VRRDSNHNILELRWMAYPPCRPSRLEAIQDQGPGNHPARLCPISAYAGTDQPIRSQTALLLRSRRDTLQGEG